MPCRKNYRDLTTDERNRFAQALHHVKSTGVVDDYANQHAMHFFHTIHQSSHFLPWHREFLRRFEDALRTFDPDITIPYWNSTEDSDTSDPLFWANDFLKEFDSAWDLDRSLGGSGLPDPGLVQQALDMTSYREFRVFVEGGLHDRPHNWVGGTMALTTSPADPVFWLHHCWIDVLWAQWQLLHPAAPFEPGPPGTAGVGLNDPLMGWTTTPADVLDHRTINLYDYPSGFTEDDLPIVTPPSSLAINFMSVPEGETRLGAATFRLNACDPVHFTVISGPTLVSGPPATIFSLISSTVVADPSVDSYGRIWFTYTGTDEGDIATGTVTIRCDETSEQWDFVLTADTIGRQTAAMVLVLDQSNSMNELSGVGAGIYRKDVLKFSVSPVTTVAEDDHAIAVCSFDQDPHPGIGMTSLSGIGRITVEGALASYAPNPQGWTSIGEAIAFAQGILNPITGYDVKTIIVFTDGQENHGPHTRRYISDVADMINANVFAIGLGRPEVLNHTALESLCNGHQGYMMVTGDLNLDTYYRMAKYYQQIVAGITNNEIVRDPDDWILPGQKHRIPFFINEADISAKGVLLTHAPYAIQYILETPNGDIIDPAVAGSHPMTSFEVGAEVSLYRFGLPIPLGGNTAHNGLWHAILTVDDRSYKRYVKSLENYPELRRLVQAHGIRYNFSVNAYSNLRMKASLSQTSHEPGSTVTIRTILVEYGMPVAFRASCRALVTYPDNISTNIMLNEIEPGIFETSIIASTSGVYHFQILSEGKTFRGNPFTREQTLTGSVWNGGNRPPPSSKDEPTKPDKGICQLVDCLLKQKAIQELLQKFGINGDELRRCLEVYCSQSNAGQPIHKGQVNLADRLRMIIPDESTLKTIMEEVQRDLRQQ